MGKKQMFNSVLLVASLIALNACRSANGSEAANLASPCQVALAEQTGDTDVDKRIARLQQDIRTNDRPHQRSALIEKLGWGFVEKARASFDPGYYRLAEQCALCLDSQPPRSQESNKQPDSRPLQSAQSIRAASLLLRGHVMHNLHRFDEAEKLARELVRTRGIAYDFGLLGDVLMEQGQLDEAVLAYQKMMELKPSPQAYSRAAHVRWLKGDVGGARALMQLAAQSAGQGDAESSAWAWSRLALFELQAGSAKQAHTMCDLALQMQNDYAPALLARGRILLAENRAGEAVAPLEKAAQINPLPEYQWALADALRAAGRDDKAGRVESELAASGAANDPRTFALYLATRGADPGAALRLAEEEMKIRRDIYTLDALAWAQLASGRAGEAWKTMQSALALKTQDARLFLHAAVIASRAGDRDSAKGYAAKAARIGSMLLPGEQAWLKELKNS